MMVNHSASALVKQTQSLIQRAGIPNAHLFLGHSFRKGGATSLPEAGHPDSLIKMMGRWSSFAFATYIDTPLHMLIEADQSLRKLDMNHVASQHVFPQQQSPPLPSVSFFCFETYALTQFVKVIDKVKKQQINII